ncbi:MAG: hypothetical protein E5V89_21220, partial [Mesorhizobium sp.]
MSLNLALVITGDASGAKQAVQATSADIKALGADASRAAANVNGAAGKKPYDEIGNSAKLASYQLTNLARQGNDVVTMLALGAPVMQVFASQAGQIFDALQTGPAGALGSLKAIGSGLLAFVATPLGAVTTATTIAVAGLAAYATLGQEKIRDVDAVLKDHERNIRALKDAYGDAANAAIAYGKTAANEGRTGIAIPTAMTEREIRLSLRASSLDVNRSLIANDNGLIGGSQMGPTINSQFKDFAAEIEQYRSSVAKGTPDVLALRKAVTEKWDLDPNNDELTREAAAIFQLTDAAARLQLALPGAKAALDALNNGRFPSFADIQPRHDYQDSNNATLYWLQQQRDATLSGINARSPEERRQAAMAAEAAKPGADNESAEVRQYRIASAGAVAYQQALHSLNEAQEQRRRSLEQTIGSAQLDLALIGKTTAEAEGLRMAFQLEQQVREEAARNGVAADEAEIASIRAKAVEYGKLIALQDARSKIRDQQDDLELQRAEIGLVGASGLAHARVIAALKTEQEIRRLGIPLYGAEAEALRNNTAAMSDMAEQLAKAGLQQQLLFERQQMFRSSIEQTVASTMKNAGLEYDPNSMIAQQIRYNEQLKQTKAAWEDIFSSVNDGIDSISDALFSGGSIEDALKKAGSQLAKTVFDMAATNPIENWLTGANKNTIGDLGIFPGAWSGKGGGFGGVLGQMLGAQKAVASMQVQAASVFINGSPIGVPGLGSIGNLIKPDGSPIVGPNTAESSAKLLAGLGSPLGFGTDSSATNSIASSASGNSVAAQIWNFFAGKGLKPFQIAGILGNVKAESAFNPLAAGDGGNALGLFQWNDRAPSLLSAIGGRGNLGNVQAQLQFAWKELQGSENVALQKLLGSTDVRGATAAFAGFERPQGFSWANPESAHNFIGRLSGAQEALARFGGSASTASTAVSQLGGASSSALSSLVSSTGTAAKGLD